MRVEEDYDNDKLLKVKNDKIIKVQRLYQDLVILKNDKIMIVQI